MGSFALTWISYLDKYCLQKIQNTDPLLLGRRNIFSPKWLKKVKIKNKSEYNKTEYFLELAERIYLKVPFSFMCCLHNSVHDPGIFWTDGREAGGCPGRPAAPGRPEGQSLPWQVMPSSLQGWLRLFPKSPLLRDWLGIGVPGGSGSPLCFNFGF